MLGDMTTDDSKTELLILIGDMSMEELIKHAVKAVSVTTEQDVELTVQNMDLSVVGLDTPYKKLSEEELAPLVAAAKAEAPAAMEVDA